MSETVDIVVNDVLESVVVTIAADSNDPNVSISETTETIDISIDGVGVENTSIVVNEVLENVSVNVSESQDVTTVSTSETVENVSISVSDVVYNGVTYNNLLINWDAVPVEVPTALDGSVFQYEYNGGATYYRYVPNTYVSSEDAFYSAFTDPTLSGLIARRPILI